MAEAAVVQVNSKRVQRALKRAPNELYRKLAQAGRTRIGPRYLAFHRARRMRAKINQRGEISGEGVRGTKKGLRSQFAVKVSGATLNTLKLKMYTKSIVALEHELGKTIFAKKGRYLAIPMDAARTVSGKISKTAYRYLNNGKLFVVRRGDNKAFLARNEKKKGVRRTVFYFHLVGRVQLKPRLQFRQLWHEYRAKAIREYNRAVGQALKAATGRGA